MSETGRERNKFSTCCRCRSQNGIMHEIVPAPSPLPESLGLLTSVTRRRQQKKKINKKRKKIWSIALGLVPGCYVFIQPFYFHCIHAMPQTHKKFVKLHFRMAARNILGRTVNLLPFRVRVVVCASVRFGFSSRKISSKIFCVRKDINTNFLSI